jgi:hypothetical protein
MGSGGFGKRSPTVVFPEYGAMELTSILPANLQSSLQGQVIELSNLQEKFIDVWTTAAQQNHVTIVAPSLPVIINGRPVNRAMVFSEERLCRLSR